MTLSDEVTRLELKSAIEHYAAALNALEIAEPKPSAEHVLEVLIARDAVSEVLPEKTKAPPEALAKLIELDSRLQQQTTLITSIGKLAVWRKSLTPPESAWWWFLEPHEEIHPQDRFDWVWNTLTVACLTVFVAYMTSLVPRFAVGGLGLLESFGVIGPSGLVALVLSSIKGGSGRDVIKKSLNHLGIPSQFQSEVTFAVSALFLMGAIATQANLPQIAELYYKQGRQYYQKGLLRKAQEQYQQALSLNPDDTKFRIALGEVYESLGNLKLAEEQYKEAVTDGTPLGFNHLGRVYLQQGDALTADTLFHIGLQRTKDSEIKFQLHRNLGWALLEQKKYDEAIQQLEAAIELDKQIPEQQIGGGMDYCFLAKVMELKGNAQEANQQWVNCQKFARPETINEYRWLVKSGKQGLAAQVDTTSVVNVDDDSERSSETSLEPAQ